MNNAIDNKQLTPEAVNRAQVAALLKKLNSGQALTEAQRNEVNDYLESEAIKNAPPIKKKRGRKAEPIVPRATLPGAMNDAQVQLVNEARDRQARNKPLANHHARALRDAWLMEQATHIWPTLAAAAADCGVSVTQMRNFAAEGCPLEPHSPIAKSPVLLWLLERAHERGANRGRTSNDFDDLDYKFREAKLHKLNQSLVADAQDKAHQGVIAVMAGVRHHLQYNLPGALVDAVIKAGTNRNAAEEAATQLIEAELRRLEPPAPIKPIPPPTTPTTETDSQ